MTPVIFWSTSPKLKNTYVKVLLSYLAYRHLLQNPDLDADDVHSECSAESSAFDRENTVVIVLFSSNFIVWSYF